MLIVLGMTIIAGAEYVLLNPKNTYGGKYAVGPLVDRTKNVLVYTNKQYGFSIDFGRAVSVQENNLSEPALGGHIYSADFSDMSSGESMMMISVSRIEDGFRNASDPLAEPNGMDPLSTRDMEGMIVGHNVRVYNEGKDDAVYVVANKEYQYMIYPGTSMKGQEVSLLKSFSFIQ